MFHPSLKPKPPHTHPKCYTTSTMQAMNELQLTEQQTAIIQTPSWSKLFLEGPAGAGKSTVGIARMIQFIQSGVWPSSILVMVPQRSLASPL